MNPAVQLETEIAYLVPILFANSSSNFLLHFHEQKFQNQNFSDFISSSVPIIGFPKGIFYHTFNIF